MHACTPACCKADVYCLHIRAFMQEYQQKTEKCAMVREVLKSHIAALPNLATPTSDGLAPLPSAGDLFS